MQPESRSKSVEKFQLGKHIPKKEAEFILAAVKLLVSYWVTLVIFLRIEPGSVIKFNGNHRNHVVSKYKVTGIGWRIFIHNHGSRKSQAKSFVQSFLIERKTGDVSFHFIVFHYPFVVQV